MVVLTSQAIVALTWFNNGHESDLEEVFRNFRRKPPERFVNVEDEVLLLKWTHHEPVHLAVVQDAQQYDSC